MVDVYGIRKPMRPSSVGLAWDESVWLHVVEDLQVAHQNVWLDHHDGVPKAEKTVARTVLSSIGR